MPLGTYTGPTPSPIATVNTVIEWKLTPATVTVGAFNPVGPMPTTAWVYSRLDRILTLAAATVVGYFDNIGMTLYKATIGTIDTANKNIPLTITNPPAWLGASVTLNYTYLDGAAELPITILS